MPLPFLLLGSHLKSVSKFFFLETPCVFVATSQPKNLSLTFEADNLESSFGKVVDVQRFNPVDDLFFGAHCFPNDTIFVNVGVKNANSSAFQGLNSIIYFMEKRVVDFEMSLLFTVLIKALSIHRSTIGSSGMLTLFRLRHSFSVQIGGNIQRNQVVGQFMFYVQRVFCSELPTGIPIGDQSLFLPRPSLQHPFARFNRNARNEIVGDGNSVLVWVRSG
ncbi:hypothetical protein L596_028231 [Steinernema carpocapsae]|uniref:Uncharacterized protein n=1 Tax=Steinernema carpocapsae TaxID=34508 RepID=A0A4U5LXV8_STECR|nr:hypothetical protein L596_028231 [Steinernema carpocapsae]